MSSRDAQSDDFLNSDAISDEFFIDIVEKKLKISRDQFKLKLVLVSPAIGKNENFVSVLYRAKIKVEILETNSIESVDVIIKALLTTIKEIKEFSVFPRERLIYEDVLSSFEQIWLEADEEISFGPKSIKFETDPYEIIVLDDLKAGNFKMLDRKVGLNMEQAKMILEKLAKFHAASAVRYQKDGTINDQFDRKKTMPPMPEDGPMAAMFSNILKAFKDSIRGYGDCDKYADKIDRWNKSKGWTSFLDMAEPMPCGFQVLNHGDLWINNMMFKSDEENNPLDVSMIDFQMPFWATPSIDLLYFMITSVMDDIKVDRFDDLIEFYHEQLSSALQKLNYDQCIPTLSELQSDLLNKGYAACTFLMFILFVVKYDSSEEINMEQMMAGMSPQTLQNIYGNPLYKKALTIWLPFLDERGFLDRLIVDDQEIAGN